jgi:hypothetical protein
VTPAHPSPPSFSTPPFSTSMSTLISLVSHFKVCQLANRYPLVQYIVSKVMSYRRVYRVRRRRIYATVQNICPFTKKGDQLHVADPTFPAPHFQLHVATKERSSWIDPMGETLRLTKRGARTDTGCSILSSFGEEKKGDNQGERFQFPLRFPS